MPEWLQSLDLADRKILGEDIKDVEFSWPIGMPLVRPLGNGLWEVRSGLRHAFIKKTQKTPQPDIDLALNRIKGELR